jgi:hypothetical protein
MDILFSVRKKWQMPPLPNASTNLNSIFSFIYFIRTHFRGLGNIVGFGNSSNSPRKYSPVIKIIDQMSGGKKQRQKAEAKSRGKSRGKAT